MVGLIAELLLVLAELGLLADELGVELVEELGLLEELLGDELDELGELELELDELDGLLLDELGELELGVLDEWLDDALLLGDVLCELLGALLLGGDEYGYEPDEPPEPEPVAPAAPPRLKIPIRTAAAIVSNDSSSTAIERRILTPRVRPTCCGPRLDPHGSRLSGD